MSEQFLKQNANLIYSWRFLRSNVLEKIEFKFEKMIAGFRNMQEKLEKSYLFPKTKDRAKYKTVLGFPNIILNLRSL